MIDRQDVIALLSDLIRIPSVNPRMSDGAGEEEIARYLAERFRALGLTPTVAEVHPRRPNVLVTLQGRPDGPHLLFEAHTDTVSPSHGQQEPFTPRLEGDRLYGRGSCDTKASVAAMFLALQHILPSHERVASVSLAFTMGEELGHEGVTHLLGAGFRADAAVVGEPTGLDVVTAHKGVFRWKLVASGRAAHSSNPREGVNAIVKMAGLIRAMNDRLVPQISRRRHPLLGPPTISVGRIEGGLQVNVVPDRCAIDVDRRTLPGETWPQVRGEVEALISFLQAEDPELHVTIAEPYLSVGSMETPPNAAIVRLAQEAVRRIDGQHPSRGVAFGTDASELSAAGVPCVVLGPGNIEQAHTSTEYVEVQQVLKAAAIYREIMMEGF